jgi:hypothetical protein
MDSVCAMSKYLEDKIRLVNELCASQIRVGYEDLALIFCAVISACAARKWEGPNIDRKRFVELLTNHSPSEVCTSWVSIAALINKNLIDEADTPSANDETRIFRDKEIDLPLADAGKKYQHVKVRDLKNCSYAALIYGWLRCGYAHEYAPNQNITQIAASSTRVSCQLHWSTTLPFSEHRELGLARCENRRLRATACDERVEFATKHGGK